MVFALVLPGLAPRLLAGEAMSFQVGGETVPAYLSRAPNSRGNPGVVLIHDYWGLNDQAHGMVDRLSRLGFVVLAPDLFNGKLVSDPGLAQEMRSSLDEK